MSIPIRRASMAPVPVVSPSPSSLLHQLLREINDDNAPRSDPIFNSGLISGEGSVNPSRRASLILDAPAVRHQTSKNSSVWAKGGSAAEDARQKLRALDEARKRKQSIPDTHIDPSTPSLDANLAKDTAVALSCPPLFSTIQYNRAATFSSTDLPSPTFEHPTIPNRGKRTGSSTYPAEAVTKKLRQDSFLDMSCRDREYHLPESIILGGEPVIATQVRDATSGDPGLQLGPVTQGPLTSTPPDAFQNTPKHAYKPFRPATPYRSPPPSEASSAGTTPPWARPLQLVDDKIAIYKNVHGEKSREKPLCLYCFRQHGEFHKIIDRECEVCGRDEIWEGHYWGEGSFWAQ